MLVSAIVSRVQTNFGDSNQVMIFESHIIDWINEGMLEIVRETQCLTAVDSTHAASVFHANTGVIIPNLLLMKRVYYGTTPLSLLDSETIDRLGIRETTDNIPQSYYMEGQGIYLFPVPTATDATTINIYYVPEPTDVDDVSDTPSIPTHYHGDLAEWVLAKAHERNENYRASEIVMTRFVKNISKRKFESLSQDDTYRTISPDVMDQDFA